MNLITKYFLAAIVIALGTVGLNASSWGPNAGEQQSQNDSSAIDVTFAKKAMEGKIEVTVVVGPNQFIGFVDGQDDKSLIIFMPQSGRSVFIPRIKIDAIHANFSKR